MSLRKVAERPMTQPWATRPLHEGAVFYGVCDRGKRYRCMVKKDTQGNLGVFTSRSARLVHFIGWQPCR